MKKLLHAKKICVTALAAILLLGGCGQKNNFDEDAYINALRELRDSIETDGLTLINYGNYSVNYWNARIRLNVNSPGIKTDITADEIVKAADEWIEEKTGETHASIDEAASNIKQAYLELPTDIPDDERLSSLSEKAVELYNSYSNLYSTVTEISGTFSEYSKSVKDNSSELADLCGEMTEMLGDETETE